MDKLTIKHWSESDKPREKLKRLGRHSLSNAELLAIIIGSGTPNEDALGIAQKLLKSVDAELNKLSKLSLVELKKHKGIGDVKAIMIMACMELGQRRKESQNPELNKIIGSEQIHQLMMEHFADLTHEEFWVIFLNRGNFIIQKKCMSKGGINGTVVDIRLILKSAIDCLASGIILCHNHPSGNLIASPEDVLLTRKCNDAAMLMDIKLLDHLIIYENKYFSFCDEGML